ncbi:hypothetical protein HD806DRAFT_502637, partial [Xylariaceae sp. AK1471]
MLGIAYYQVPKSAMSKLLRRLADPPLLPSNIVVPGITGAVETSTFKPISMRQQPTPTVPPSAPTRQTVDPSPQTTAVDNNHSWAGHGYHCCSFGVEGSRDQSRQRA